MQVGVAQPVVRAWLPAGNHPLVQKILQLTDRPQRLGLHALAPPDDVTAGGDVLAEQGVDRGVDPLDDRLINRCGVCAGSRRGPALPPNGDFQGRWEDRVSSVKWSWAAYLLLPDSVFAFLAGRRRGLLPGHPGHRLIDRLREFAPGRRLYQASSATTTRGFARNAIGLASAPTVANTRHNSATIGLIVSAQGHDAVSMQPSLYEYAGGDGALLRLARAHHARCLADPELNHPFSILINTRSTSSGWPRTGPRCSAGHLGTPTSDARSRMLSRCTPATATCPNSGGDLWPASWPRLTTLPCQPIRSFAQPYAGTCSGRSRRWPCRTRRARRTFRTTYRYRGGAGRDLDKHAKCLQQRFLLVSPRKLVEVYLSVDQRDHAFLGSTARVPLCSSTLCRDSTRNVKYVRRLRPRQPRGRCGAPQHPPGSRNLRVISQFRYSFEPGVAAGRGVPIVWAILASLARSPPTSTRDLPGSDLPRGERSDVQVR